jgi:SAM-dependent MidA family methyltransferase
VTWHDHLSEIDKDKPIILIANEFFDALPVRQFKFEDEQWLEHYIDADETVWQAIDNPPLKPRLPAPQNDDIFEYSDIQADYAKLIASYHGWALFIDYGYEQTAYGDTVQAVYKHNYCALTDHVGEADITSHVDFQWLESFFNSAKILTQRQFLLDSGINVRYRQLNAPSLQSGYERLIDPAQMGTLFKVMDVSL